MTADEITIEIYNRLGYYCVSSVVPRQIGQLLPKGESNNPYKTIPMKVISKATQEDFDRQGSIVNELAPGSFFDAASYVKNGYKFFYKVEAAD